LTSVADRLRLYIQRRRERKRPYKPLEFWEKRGPTYPEKMEDGKFREVTQEHRLVLRGMFDTISIERFIEVGCGSGRLFDLYGGFAHVVGVDMTSSMLENASSVVGELNLKGIELIRASATRLPLVSGSFDCALTSEVLLHITPEFVATAVHEMLRIARYAIFLEFYTSEYQEPRKLRRKRRELASWNFLHEYPKIFGELGLRIVKSVELKSVPQTCFLVTRA
jgi:ubiquinone/menaquinone biosynthesis C-methylase UbiE